MLSWLSALGRRLSMLVGGRRFERELDEEMRLHRELRARELEAAGLPPDAADRAAARRFGSALHAREDSRAAWGWAWLENALHDLRHALRDLRRNPGFAAVVIATLALGIGASTAIFTVVDRVLLRPLPYPDAARLVTMRSRQSLPDLEDIRARTSSYDALGAMVTQGLDYTGGAEPVQIQGGLCNADLFTALGAHAAIGRVLAPAEDVVGGPRVVVLSHGFWTRYLGGDPEAVGRTIPLGGEPYTVIGVMPADFTMPFHPADVWASLLVANPTAAQWRGVHFLETFLRLRPGVELAAARAEMAVVDEGMARDYPDENLGRHRVVAPLLDVVVADARPALLILLGAVGLLLVIASVNFASLRVARAAARRRELVIRAALGAGRARLVAQLLTESVLLAVLGGAAGLALAQWGLDLLLALAPASLPRAGSVGIDARVVGFAALLSVVTGLLFGLIPALGAARLDVNEGLKETAPGGGRLRLRRALVVAETALALVLLVGAGLLIKSFWVLRTVEPGFRPDGLLTMRLELPESRYRERPVQRELRARLLESLAALPGAQAAMVSEPPMTGQWLTHNVVIDGRPPVPAGAEPELQTRTVGGDYFHVMGIPLRAGRDFTAADGPDAPLVVLVNDAFVRTYFPGGDPLGARIRWARGEPQWMTIVGVVGDVRHFGLDQPEEPAAYDLYAQTQQPWKRWMWLVVRSPVAPRELAHEVTAKLWALDARLPVTRVATMTEVMSTSVDTRRFHLTIMCLFAAVALAMAAIGIYGVMAYAVTQRSREIGIRVALGAKRGDILRMVIGEGGRLAGLGALIGLAGALALAGLMSSLLYGISARDPTIFAGVAALLFAVALLACTVPARRALRVDPMSALRQE